MMIKRLMLSVCVLVLVMAGHAGAAPVTPADVVPRDCATLRSSATPLDAPPVGLGPCPGVRPGALVATEDLEGATWECTFGFVFEGFERSVERRSLGRYITTAGTCAVPWDGEEWWRDGEGPKAFDSTGKLIGRYVYAHSGVQSSGMEYALIKVLPGVSVNPQVCYFGGPTGPVVGAVPGPVQLRQVGQGTYGVALGRPAFKATDLATEGPNDWLVGSWLPDDTGGPVITEDGRAVGLITAGGAGIVGDSDPVTLFLTRLQPATNLAEEALGIDLQLLTAPLL